VENEEETNNFISRKKRTLARKRRVQGSGGAEWNTFILVLLLVCYKGLRLLWKCVGKFFGCTQSKNTFSKEAIVYGTLREEWDVQLQRLQQWKSFKVILKNRFFYL
jgi:hypothetical protein